jgi:hypothetical protein
VRVSLGPDLGNEAEHSAQPLMPHKEGGGGSIVNVTTMAISAQGQCTFGFHISNVPLGLNFQIHA